MKLNILQQMLEGLYQVSIDYSVEDFVITDPELARRLDASANARESREKLLVAQQGNELHLSLYLDSGVLDRLADDCPFDELHNENLEDFLLALEGVSHFLYVSWNAGFDRGVTLLELEMQAEVDKYVLANSLFTQQRRDVHPKQVWRCLFDSPSFDEALEREELERYVDASRYAGRFCSQLETQYLRRNRSSEMVSELRRFYRMTQAGKISHINAV
jgi:hypothetical protein